MKKSTMLFTVFMAGMLYTTAGADIYVWTDDNGVKHFTNYAPPPQAKIIMKDKEIPYDAAADKARREAEQLKRMELARLERAEKEAEIARQKLAAEQTAAEANRKAAQALRQAEALLEAARNQADNSGGSYISYGYYPYPYYGRWPVHYPHYGRWPHHYARDKIHYDHRYRHRTRPGYKPPPSHFGHARSTYRLNSSARSHFNSPARMRRAGFARSGLGFGRRR